MSEEICEAIEKLSQEFHIQAKVIEADPFGGNGQLAAADIGRAIAYRDASKKLRAILVQSANLADHPDGCMCPGCESVRLDAPPAGPPMLDLYREALERLADEDTPVLGEGLGGGPQEELHVRASFAAHTLGRDTCGCTECMVSLGLEPDDDYPDVSGGGVPYPASADVDL